MELLLEGKGSVVIEGRFFGASIRDGSLFCAKVSVGNAAHESDQVAIKYPNNVDCKRKYKEMTSFQSQFLMHPTLFGRVAKESNYRYLTFPNFYFSVSRYLVGRADAVFDASSNGFRPLIKQCLRTIIMGLDVLDKKNCKWAEATLEKVCMIGYQDFEFKLLDFEPCSPGDRQHWKDFGKLVLDLARIYLPPGDHEIKDIGRKLSNGGLVGLPALGHPALLGSMELQRLIDGLYDSSKADGSEEAAVLEGQSWMNRLDSKLLEEMNKGAKKKGALPYTDSLDDLIRFIRTLNVHLYAYNRLVKINGTETRNVLAFMRTRHPLLVVKLKDMADGRGLVI